MPDRWRPSSRWRTATRSCAAAPRNFRKASGPSLRSESLSISSAETTRSVKDKKFRETQNEWECGGGDDEARLSQGRVAGARHRRRAPRRRHGGAEVAHSLAALRKTPPGLAGEMGEASARAHLAGAARWPQPRMAKSILRRSQAHRGRADAGAAESQARWSSGCDPLRQLHRARVDDAGRDAGALAGGSRVAGLLVDEPRPRQAEISVRSDQAGRRYGTGRCDLREGARRA